MLAAHFIYLLDTYCQICKKSIETQFDKKTRRAQASLQLIADRKSLNNQKMLADFNLFASKKHDSLTKLYGLLVEAKGAVFEVASVIQFSPSGEEWNKSDYENFLTESNLPHGMCQVRHSKTERGAQYYGRERCRHFALDAIC